MRSVARAHDIPSNQLFHWRKLYREGLLGNAAQATQSKLVAVRLLGEQQQSAIARTRRACNQQSQRAWE